MRTLGQASVISPGEVLSPEPWRNFATCPTCTASLERSAGEPWRKVSV